MENFELIFKKCQNGELKNLSVKKEGDTVLLTGTVSRYYIKQLAQEILRPHLNGTRLINLIEVK